VLLVPNAPTLSDRELGRTALRFRSLFPFLFLQRVHAYQLPPRRWICAAMQQACAARGVFRLCLRDLLERFLNAAGLKLLNSREQAHPHGAT
jgi:hypothetical protein